MTVFNLLLQSPSNAAKFLGLLLAVPKDDPAAAFVYLLVALLGTGAILFTATQRYLLALPRRVAC